MTTWAKAILQQAYRSTDAATPVACCSISHGDSRPRIRAPRRASEKGFDETLTALVVHLPDTLRRSVTTTNAAESLVSRIRHVKRNVKRWRGGRTVVRWVAAEVLEAVKDFRRLKGTRRCRSSSLLCAPVINSSGSLKSRRPSRRLVPMMAPEVPSVTSNKLGRLEVAHMLENFFAGTGGPWEWDDFISVGNLADERLRQIQRHVNVLSEEFPPEEPGEYCNEQGREVIRRYIAELRRS